MAEQHRATDKQWRDVKEHNYLAFSCLLELRDRIEALEAAQQAKPNHPEKTDSSLVKRVANAMDGGTEWQARAAIREVAAWLREQKHYGHAWSIRFEKEAER